jgi:hypothetical protein
MAMPSADDPFNLILIKLTHPPNTPVPTTWVGNALYLCPCPGDNTTLAPLDLRAAMNNPYDSM